MPDENDVPLTEAEIRRFVDEGQKWLTILTEISIRIQSIDTILRTKSQFRVKIVEEICCIQFRMIFELLSFGVLLLNKDIPLTRSKDFLKEYRADWIIRKLSRMDASHYPIPVTESGLRIFSRSGPLGVAHPMKEGFLTQEDLVSAYVYCGNRLHRGSAKKLYIEDTIADIPYLISIRDKVINLLQKHYIGPMAKPFMAGHLNYPGQEPYVTEIIHPEQ